MNVSDAHALLEKITAFTERTEKEIEWLIAAFDRRARAWQRRLWEKLLQELGPLLRTDNGRLSENPGVSQRVNSVFDDFERSVLRGEMAEFGQNLLDLASRVSDYYTVIGYDKELVESVALRIGWLYEHLGIEPTGGLVPGGYLDRLAKTAEVRETLRGYVIQSVVTRRPLREYTAGLKQLVVGNKDANGALVRYFEQYAYDSFNQAHELSNQFHAEQLGLKWFVYQGSVIVTTRAFCRKRAGKVFSVEETKKWKDDPDLVDKKTAATYNPLIERGRYNCRHFIRYVSEELAERMREGL